MGHIENKAGWNYLYVHNRRRNIDRLKLTGNFCPHHKIVLNFRNDVTIFIEFSSDTFRMPTHANRLYVMRYAKARGNSRGPFSLFNVNGIFFWIFFVYIYNNLTPHFY